MKKWNFALLLGSFLAAGLAPSYAQEPVAAGNPSTRGRTLMGHKPWDPAALQAAVEPKVVYGPDDRKDVYQESSPVRLAQAAATCGLFDSFDVTNNGNGTYTIDTYAYEYAGRPPCSGEPFASQPISAFCSGFLVGPDIIATAGHCYNASDIASVRFVFGFKMTDVSTPVTLVPASQVYSGLTLLGHQLVGDDDYTVVKLDRTVTAAGASPLAIRRSGTVPLNTAIGVIGHPWGLPMKIAFGATTAVHFNSNPSFFIGNLDTYGGNSGSPVFNAASGVVEGILVRGANDFVVGSTCFTSSHLPDSPGGEGVTKSTTFSSFVPPLATAADSIWLTLD